MQAIAHALCPCIILHAIVGLSIFRLNSLPLLPGTSRFLTQEFHHLIVLAVVLMPCYRGFPVGSSHMEIAETALHRRYLRYLLVLAVIAHTRKLIGIPLTCYGESTIVDLTFRLAVPVEVTFHVAVGVEFAADGLHRPLVVPVGLTALEGTVLVPRSTPNPL